MWDFGRQSYINSQVDGGAGSRDKNTGKRKGGDWLGDWIYQVDQDDYAGVKDTRAGVALQETYGDTGIADKYGISLKDDSGAYRPTNLVEDDITRVKTNKQMLRDNGLTDADVDVDSLTASNTEVGSAIRSWKDQKREQDLKPERDLKTAQIEIQRNTRKDNAEHNQATLQLQREQGQQRDALNRHELKVKQIEAQNERALRKWESQGKRDDAKMQLMMQFQSNQLDRQYERERDERADARADKKERQMMVMQLVKGLTNMGQAFAL